MITSIHNPRLKRIRQLLARRETRREEGAFVIEGVRLCEEAAAGGWEFEFILTAENLSARGQALARQMASTGIDVEAVSAELLNRAADTETSPGILAVLRLQELALPSSPDFLLICDNLRDPGNLGTILRTALAAGVQGVLLTRGTTDAFAPKVLRAGMGAHFRLPIRDASPEDLRALLRQSDKPLTLLAADAELGVSCWQSDLTQPLALAVGGEAEGVSPEVRAIADGTIRIPMPGGSESLNAAVAASILMFETCRQRSR